MDDSEREKLIKLMIENGFMEKPLTATERKTLAKAMGQTFLDVYKPIMTELGFSRKGKIFHRLAGKVIQRLSIFRYSRPGEFTIQFDFIPLCAGGEIDTFMDADRLDFANNWVPWIFNDLHGKDTMIKTLELCKEHLFPYLDKLVDYENFLKYDRELFRKMVRGMEMPAHYGFIFPISLATSIVTKLNINDIIFSNVSTGDIYENEISDNFVGRRTR